MSLTGTSWHMKEPVTLPSAVTYQNSAGLFTITDREEGTVSTYTAIKFESNKIKFTGAMDYQVYGSYGNDYIWFYSDYRTITFINEPTSGGDNLEAWLNSNAITPKGQYLVDGNDLFDIAEVIRHKTGDSSSLRFPANFLSDIRGI